MRKITHTHIHARIYRCFEDRRLDRLCAGATRKILLALDRRYGATIVRDRRDPAMRTRAKRSSEEEQEEEEGRRDDSNDVPRFQARVVFGQRRCRDAATLGSRPLDVQRVFINLSSSNRHLLQDSRRRLVLDRPPSLPVRSERFVRKVRSFLLLRKLLIALLLFHARSTRCWLQFATCSAAR